MSKFYLLSISVLSLLAATPSQASTEVDITLITITNIKIKSVHRVRVQDEKIFFDSEQIDPVQLPRAVGYIRGLAKVKEETRSACSSGTYTHTVVKNKKQNRVSGCLDSPRAAELTNSMSQLQKLNILKK